MSDLNSISPTLKKAISQKLPDKPEEELTSEDWFEAAKSVYTEAPESFQGDNNADQTILLCIELE